MFYVSIKNGGKSGTDGEWISIFEPVDKNLTIHSPKVTLELGKAGSFTFTVPDTNTYYKQIRQLSTLVLVEWGDKRNRVEIFRGRVFQISMNFMKMKVVTCEGTLAYLVDSIQKASSYNGTAHALFRKIITAHNNQMDAYPDKKFIVGNITIENATVIIPKKKDDDDKYYGDKYSKAVIEALDDEYLTTYDFINTMLIDYLGGYLVTRTVNGTNYIDYLSDDDKNLDDDASTGGFNSSEAQKIEYGVNLLDFTEEMDAEDLCTVVIPLGDSEDDKVLTIEKATNTREDNDVEVVKIGGKSIGIAHKASVDKYGWIVKTHSFSNVNQANTLFTNGRKWLKRNRNIPIRYTIKAVDLKFLDTESTSGIIKLGEMVQMVSSPHKLKKRLMCTKVEYDLENPANNSYTIGNPEQTMTERYKKNKDKEKKESRQRSGRSGSAAGSAAGAAADAAQEDLDITSTELEERISDAQIVTDPDKGMITLQAWYKKNKDTLQRVGIDMYADRGLIDVYATYETVNDKVYGNASLKVRADEYESSIRENVERINENGTAIGNLNLYANDLEAALEAILTYETDASLSDAEIRAKADADHAEIDLLAKWKDKANESIESIAEIKTMADKNGAAIDLLTKHRSETMSALAALQIKANELESKIQQIADFQTETAKTTAEITTKSDANVALIEMITKWKDETTGMIKGLAQTKQWVDDHSANIVQATEWYEKVGDSSLTTLSQLSDATIAKIIASTDFIHDNMHSLTHITQWSDEKSANIESAAEFVNKAAADGSRSLTRSISGIKQTADNNKAVLQLFTSYKGEEGENIAKITLKSDAFKSMIDLEADAVFTSSLKAEGGITVENHLQCGSLSVGTSKNPGSISCYGNIGNCNTITTKNLQILVGSKTKTLDKVIEDYVKEHIKSHRHQAKDVYINGSYYTFYTQYTGDLS